MNNWTIEPLFAGETCVCIASGPSLTKDQVDYCRGKARIIVINRSVELAPWADVLYCCDKKMVDYLQGAPEFDGLKITQSCKAAKRHGWLWVKSEDKPGLSSDTALIHQGSNSGYQAVNLAALMGASRILLLGYDMRPNCRSRHWHDDDGPNITVSPYQLFREKFATIAKEGLYEIITCTPGSALTMFPVSTIEHSL